MSAMAVDSGAMVKVTFDVFDEDGDNCKTVQLDLSLTLTSTEFLSKVQAEVTPSATFSNMSCIGIFENMNDFTNSLADWIKLNEDGIEWDNGCLNIQIGPYDVEGR